MGSHEVTRLDLEHIILRPFSSIHVGGVMRYGSARSATNIGHAMTPGQVGKSHLLNVIERPVLRRHVTLEIAKWQDFDLERAGIPTESITMVIIGIPAVGRSNRAGWVMVLECLSEVLYALPNRVVQECAAPAMPRCNWVEIKPSCRFM